MPHLIDNKKAFFDYEVLEQFEAGIELLGTEVKSLKGSHGSLEGAFVVIRGGQAFLHNMLIPAYQEKNAPKDYEPRRVRRLLLNKKEMAQLSSNEGGKGLTVVPISVYTKSNLIKLGIALVKGKKKHDKREATKTRETNREMERTLKDQ